MKFSVAAGYYPDGKIGEIFLAAEKPGSELGTLVSDAAILASLALQHGASLNDLRHALQRDSDASPATLLGSALELLRFVDQEKSSA